MLVKCPECGSDVSDEAASCPKCGFPRPAAGPKPPGKRTTLAGWASLATFALASNVSFYWAGILGLVQLVLAGKELKDGNILLGATALVLATLNSYLVVSHYIAVNTRPRAMSTQSVAPGLRVFATFDYEGSRSWGRTIEEHCSKQAGASQQAQCAKLQEASVKQLAESTPADGEQDAFQLSRIRCAKASPKDFQMRAYCEGQQIQAYRELKNSTEPQSVRSACARNWRDDYRMRRECELATRPTR